MGMSVTISVATEQDAEQIFRLQYLCFQSEAALYGPGASDPQRFTQTLQSDHHRFAVVVSFPEFPQLPHFDRTAFMHQYMRQVERDLGTRVEWMAANHYDTAHPHTHILLRGVSQGEDLYMKPGYFKHGLHEQASRLLTLMAGPVRERRFDVSTGNRNAGRSQ